MFEGQPKGLYALALANTGERFGYYTMLAIFVLFLKANFGLSPGMAGTIYSTFLALVYFLPFIGGILADKFGYGKMVTIGIIAMFAGYVLLALPLGSGTLALACMFSALLVISTGTGLFKGNLQVMVGNLYDSPEYASKRDSAFSIFYMAINIGALFAPTAAVKIMEYAQQNLGVSVNELLSFCFRSGLHFSDHIHGYLLFLSPHIQACGRKYQTNKRRKGNGQSGRTLSERNKRPYHSSVFSVCSCHLFLDGIPPKRTYPDLFCR